ncbi:MAG: metallophosphoesterase [Acidobacteriaceae bacterium]
MTSTETLRRSLLTLAATFALIATAPAQSPAPSRAATAARTNVAALFLSDIHLDPFADPAKVAKLNAAASADWPAILSAPASPTQAKDFAALQEACLTKGIDTPWVLWQSSLTAIHADASQARFVTVSGDLLAHSFDCKYQKLLPAAKSADYMAFTEKTVRTLVSTLRAALPGVPVYVAMGNNDSGCGDYELDAAHDAFLGLVAKIVADALPAADHAEVERDFAAGGYYNVPLAGVAHTRLIAIDDLFFSGKYTTCSGKADPAPAATQLAWLAAQLASARQHKEQVWVMGHIPPGVDVYATARKNANLCAGGKPQMFLASESLPELLAANSDVVRLAIFGHSHADEMRLLTPESNTTHPSAQSNLGVPLKIVSSITPINGNRPTFTLASIDPATATLDDYSVFMASNSTGVGTTWTKEYTYSTAYRERAFDAESLVSLIPALQADRTAKRAASQAYLRNYFPGDLSIALQGAWPQYTCSLDHDTAAGFSVCACSATK